MKTGVDGVNDKTKRETLERSVTERKERIVGWFTQPYYDKGFAEGFAEGGARVLEIALETRFGALPADVRQRIFSADWGSLDAWIDRVFDAPDLQSIFKSD